MEAILERAAGERVLETVLEARTGWVLGCKASGGDIDWKPTDDIL